MATMADRLFVMAHHLLAFAPHAQVPSGMVQVIRMDDLDALFKALVGNPFLTDAEALAEAKKQVKLAQEELLRGRN